MKLGKDWQGVLAIMLDEIEHADTDYPKRYGIVFEAVDIALKLGYPAGIRIDPAEPEWPVVYIELPTGQVSWHMPQHPVPYDGHTTEQKYERTRAYIGGER